MSALFSFPFVYYTLISYLAHSFLIQGSHFGHSIRDLERGEGAALHAHLFEETIDWAEPLRKQTVYKKICCGITKYVVVEMPPEAENAAPKIPQGGNSEEKLVQEEREQTALGAVYMSLNQIPDSPAEPNQIISEEEVDRNVTHMSVGPENDLILWHDSATTPTPAASVADLVGQLGNNQMDTTVNAVGPSTGLDLGVAAAAQSFLPQEQLQMLLQQLQVPGGPFGAVTPYSNSADPTWTSTPNHFGTTDYGYHEDHQADQQQDFRWSDGRGRGRGYRGGRGRGRGEESFRPYNTPNKKKMACSFFAAGRRALNPQIQIRRRLIESSEINRCKYGDSCGYTHDVSML